MIKARIASLSLILAAAGCAHHPAPAPAATVAVAPTYPVITKLVGRHHTITISAGPTAALYSVQSPDGTPLVAFVTLDEMRKGHPEYFELIKPVVALDTAELLATSAVAE